LIVSWRITTPSRICLPGMKTIWVVLIIFSAIVKILFVATLVKKWKLTLSKQIGLYCSIWTVFSFYGRTIIVPKLRSKSGNSLLKKLLNMLIKSPFIRSQISFTSCLFLKQFFQLQDHFDSQKKFEDQFLMKANIWFLDTKLESLLLD
jgi:hypothetical protein